MTLRSTGRVPLPNAPHGNPPRTAMITLTDDSQHCVPASQHANWVGMAAVAALALVVRLVHVWLTMGVPTVRHPVGDAAGYLAWAQTIAGGNWWGREAFYQAPLYPYVLAGLLVLFGDGVGVVRVAQACFGAASTACMYVAGRRLFGPTAGLLSAIILALYAPAIHYDSIVQKTSLAGLLTCALLAAATARRALLCGVVLGLLALTRENAFVWWPVVGMWLAASAESPNRPEERQQSNREGKKPPGHQGTEPSAETPTYRNADPQSAIRSPQSAIPSRWRPVVLFALGTMLVLGPVAVRNRALGGSWTLSTFQAGPNFYIGNGETADGRYVPLVRGHESPEFERGDAKRLAEEAAGFTLTPREVSRYWFSRAWVDIAADPARWMALLCYKVLLTVNRYEVADAESLYVFTGLSPVLSVVTPVWHFGVLAPLAVFGWSVARPRRRQRRFLLCLAVAMVCAVAAFFVLGRYRHPVALVLLPLSAMGILGPARFIFRRKSSAVAAPRGDGAVPPLRVRLWRGVGGAALVAAACNWPIQDEQRLDALAWMNVGVAAARAGEVETATSYFELAMEQHPQSPEARYNLATSLAMQGRFAEAVPHYQIAHRLAPGAPGLDFNWGVALERLGRIDEALACYRRAVEVDPGDVEAQRAIGRLTGSPESR